VNALDLAKVGKAFGFAVPPRVNVSIGGGKTGGANKSRFKRRREDDDDDMNEGGEDEGEDGARVEDGEEATLVRSQGRRQGKERRMESLGKKRVDKEVYKKGEARRKMGESAQWSR
jgi:ATP-dependent RNA helicase DDX18/HAS1